MPPIPNLPNSDISIINKFKQSSNTERGLFLVAIIIVVGFFVCYNIYPPNDYPSKNSQITVAKGESITDLANTLEDIGVIRSRILFRIVYRIFGGSTIQAGSYRLGPDRLNLISLARGISNQSLKDDYIRLTIPEGLSVYEIGKIIKKTLPNFDEVEFVSIASPHEGYLFPDTYFVENNITAKTALDIMLDNFETKTKDLLVNIGQNNLFSTSTNVLDKTIIMASILEEEGKDYKSRQIIAGILYKRLAANMLLQVDASFIYVNGKKSNINSADLEIDSPFNTYKYRGLPPHPIANPGLESIKAAINPVDTEYLFYLSDLKGNLYYARTFEEHKVNREKYLNK